MPVDTRWYDDNQSIILCDYHGEWTHADHVQTVQLTRQMMDETTSARVDIIVRFSGSLRSLMNMSDKNYNPLRDAHPKLGLIVSVTGNRLFTAVASIGLRANALARRYYRLADSVQAAITLVQSDRTGARQ